MVGSLLVKIPSRERPHKFFPMLSILLSYTKNLDNVRFLLTLDNDDFTMSLQNQKAQFQMISRVYGAKVDLVYGDSLNKVHAINRDLETYDYPWDVLILTSDDMVPNKYGYDEIIMNTMKENFPDTDGVIYSPDGFTPLNTLPIIGRKYYDRFKYVYNPIYQSFFPDNEFHAVSQLLRKEKKINDILFRHMHPANTGQGNDNLYMRNNEPWSRDEQTFKERLAKNFDVDVPMPVMNDLNSYGHKFEGVKNDI